MRSFKTMAATGLAMATLIASVTAAGAVQIDPTGNIFEPDTDDEIVTPAVAAYDDPYEAVENEIWEARRDAELKTEERESAQAALEAARAVDPFEAALIEQVMLTDGLTPSPTTGLRVTTPTVPAYTDSYEAFENEVWEARREAELKADERESAQAALEAARAFDPFEATLVEQVMLAEGLTPSPTTGLRVTTPTTPAFDDPYGAFENEVWEIELTRAVAELERETAQAALEAARAGSPVVTIDANDLDEQLMAFTLRDEVDVRTLPRAANPVGTIGANDFDEQLIAFALQNEVGAWTPPTVRTAAVSGVDPYEEHGRLIDYVLHVEMSEYD